MDPDRPRDQLRQQSGSETPPERIGAAFYVAAVSAGIFVVTIFACVATLFSDPNHPGAKFLDRYGAQLLIGEAVLTVLLGITAMTIDRVRTLSESTEAEGVVSPGAVKTPDE